MTTRGLAVAVAGAVAAAAVAAAVYGLHAAAETLEILVPVGALAVFGAALLVARRERAGGLRRQAALTAALVLAQLAVAVALLARVMLVSSMDALFTGLVVAYACLVGAWAARVLGLRVMADVDVLRRGLADVGAGERELRLTTTARDELHALAGDVEAMTRRLGAEERARKAAEAARRQLLIAVSHDLRTPLTSIQLLAQALEDGIADPAGQRDYAARIALNATTLGRLVDDLFELTRLQAGDVGWTMEQLDVADLVTETVDAIRPQAEAGSIAVRVDVADPPSRVRGDPEKLQRVLFNLLQNAIRHTPADGSVTVRAERRADTVEVEVADTGDGIAPADREAVFEAFFQGGARGDARNTGTAGLGLAIARAIVEAHGGRIWLPETDRGTRVRFSLPGPQPAVAGVGVSQVHA